MAVVYYPKANVMAKRDTANVAYEEVVLSLNPNTVLYFDSGSGINAISASVIMLTASWAQNAIAVTSSYSLYSITSSFAASAGVASSLNFVPNTALFTTQSQFSTQSLFATQSIQATFATQSVQATFATASVSSSWASASISASHAVTSSYVTNLYPQTYQESGSWASASISASYSSNSSNCVTASYSIAVSQISSSTGDSPNLPAGLLAYYNFSGNSRDCTYFHHDAIDTNMSYGTGGALGKVGQGANFMQDTGSYIKIINQIPYVVWANEHSIVFWICHAPSITPATHWVFNAGNALESIIIATPANGSTIAWTSGPVMTSTSSIASGSWTHIALTKGGGTIGGAGTGRLRIYINGTQDTASAATMTAPVTDTTPQMFGLERLALKSAMTGSLDEFGVWGRELSAAEVLSLYNGGAGKTY